MQSVGANDTDAFIVSKIKKSKLKADINYNVQLVLSP